MNILFFKKEISGIVFFVMLANLIIGGVLLPYQQAHAVLALLPTQIVAYVGDALKWAWDKIQIAYTKVQSGLQTGFQAVMSAFDISQEIQDKIAAALKWAFTAFKKKLLDMMADQIIKWVNGGGKPTFVTDWRAFLNKAVNDVGGNFVAEYLGANFLCKKFSPQIQIMLAGPRTFDTAAKCTLGDIDLNIRNFFTDTIKGGWKGWLKVSETQNNIYGMYFYALDKKWSMEELAAKTGSEAAQAGAGFLGDQVCLRYYRINPSGIPQEARYDANENAPKRGEAPAPFTDAHCTEWFTRTPGKVAADTVSKVAGKDWDWLLQSKEYSEYIVAILDAVMNRLIKDGLAYLVAPSANASPASFTVDYSTVIGNAGLNDYKDASTNGPYITHLIPQEKLLKENLQKILTEYQTNLTVLNQIRTVQTDAFNTLKNIVQNSCNLPGGTSQQSLGVQNSDNCGSNQCPCQTTAIETIKITASNVGEVTFQITTVAQRNYDNDTGDCTKTNTSRTAAIINASPSTDTEITQVNNEISQIQTQLGLIDNAVSDLENYQTALAGYNTAYDATQSHIGSQPGNEQVAASTVNAMYSAKQKAIDSTKLTISSQQTSLDKLLSDVMTASQDTATQNNAVVEKRGMDMASVGCSYSTGYYKTLCDIQALKTSWDNTLDSCLSAP